VSAETKLSSSTTISDYQKMLSQKDSIGIADFLLERFNERYLIPFSDKNINHGFSMMTVSCLMVEVLESFRQSWENSNSRSALAFCYFISRSDHFSELSGKHQEIYKNIRCGLLHQGETTGGWTITTTKSEFVDFERKIINAQIFMERLALEMKSYIQELKSSEWNSELWQNTNAKIKYICKQFNES